MITLKSTSPFGAGAFVKIRFCRGYTKSEIARRENCSVEGLPPRKTAPIR